MWYIMKRNGNSMKALKKINVAPKASRDRLVRAGDPRLFLTF